VAGMDSTQRLGAGRTAIALRLGGAGLLAAAGAIHLDLYLTGYSSIPTIGPLFLLQVIAAFGLTAVILATGSRLLSAAGALLALAVLGGYLVALRFGLFGFREVRTTAGIAAGCIEVAAFAALGALALRTGVQSVAAGPVARADSLIDRVLKGIPGVPQAAAGVCLLAALLFGIGVATASETGTGTKGTVLSIGTVGGVTVLTNAQGFTLYWFARDTSGTSNCNGACAQYWPPVIGASTAAADVSGTLGTIQRADGSNQTTFDGHPLYTYAGDSAPGQDTGNGITLYGGVWHQVAAPGAS